MRASLLAILTGVIGLSAASAQAEYPERPITMIVPYSAGGGSDRTSRTLAPYLEEHLGVSIAVVNRPGAGGSIGYTELSAAEADGYTIGLVNFPDAVTGPFLKEVDYAIDDFAFLGAINREPTTLAVRADSKIETLADFIAAARDQPGSLSVGVPSLSNVHSIGVSRLAAREGLAFNKVPFNGGGPTINALLGGHVNSAALATGALASHAGEEGELRMLAQMAESRAENAPEVPTLAEEGIELTNYVYRNLAVPAGVPADVLARLRTAFEAALRDPGFQEAAAKQKISVEYVDGERLTATAAELDTELRELWETTPWMPSN